MQEAVAFDDAAIYFSEEWRLLEERQRDRFKDVTMENPETFTTPGSQDLKSDIVVKLEQEETLHATDQPVVKMSERNSDSEDFKPDIIVQFEEEETPYVTDQSVVTKRMRVNDTVPSCRMQMVAPMKRKIDAECRVFNDSWTSDFFVVEQNGSILCLICQKEIAVCKKYNVKRHYHTTHATLFDSLTGQVRIDRANLLKQNVIAEQTIIRAKNQSSESAAKISYLIAETIAKRGKPFSDGNFVKDCLDIFTSVACPDQKSIVDKSCLSRMTVARRINDLALNIENTLIKRLDACEFYSLGLIECIDVGGASKLAIFIRGVTKMLTIVEELLDVCQLKGTAIGEDIFHEVSRVMLKFSLTKDKLCGLTTDGTPAMTRENDGFISLMLKSMPHKVITHHCFIHLEQLYNGPLEMEHVMEKIVSTINFIKVKGRNHKPFQSFLEKMKSDCDDAVYISQVCWLNRAVILATFWSLLEEIKIFMINKGKDVTYMNNDEWLNDLAFIVDMTKYLADLNVKLQVNGQIVSRLYEHVQSFIQKLELIKKQVAKKNVVHFTMLSTRPSENVNHEKYSVLIDNLTNELKRRFVDFREHSEELNLFAYPFGTDANDAPEMFQLEIIDLQNNSDMKRAFAGHDLLTFYSLYVPSQTYPNLSKHALQFIALFGSTHCYKHFFSSMKSLGAKSKSLLTDGHLSGFLRVATSSVPADIDYLSQHT